jgi:hypothetical protein
MLAWHVAQNRKGFDSWEAGSWAGVDVHLEQREAEEGRAEAGSMGENALITCVDTVQMKRNCLSPRTGRKASRNPDV